MTWGGGGNWFLLVTMSSSSIRSLFVLQAITAGFFDHTARLQKSGNYRTIKNPQTVHIHPQCVPFPYHEYLSTFAVALFPIHTFSQPYVLHTLTFWLGFLSFSLSMIVGPFSVYSFFTDLVASQLGTD